jgi:hypothetical protein
LRELEFMDSSGLHVIVAADRRIRSAGGQLVLVRGPAQVDRLLALVGIDCQLELVDQPPAAAREDVCGVSYRLPSVAEGRTVAVDGEIVPWVVNQLRRTRSMPTPHQRMRRKR